jgi:predicted amidophosphoribosyltransferase
MRFFRRKPSVEVEPERCPLCRERVPEDADLCAMCGADLRSLRQQSERGVSEPATRLSPG